MPSAEVSLQMKTIVGNSSPTVLQTLQKLANLYEYDDTDVEHWHAVIESHPRVLIHFPSTAETPQFCTAGMRMCACLNSGNSHWRY